MSKFLFVSTYDLRRNTSSNIRTVALMKALHDNGHIVHCFFVTTHHKPDEELLNALSSVDMIITYPQKSTSDTSDKADARQGLNTTLVHGIKQSIRSFMIKLYGRISVYDVFKIPIINIGVDDFTDLADDYDYVISSSEPRSSHLLAEKIISYRRLSAKWVLYWGDPMTNDVASTKIFPFLEKREEKRLIKKADFSIYTNPCAADYMRNKYPGLSGKIDWIPTSDVKQHIQNNVPSGNRVGYFGDYRQMYRNIHPFIEACEDYGIDTIIVGSGDKELQSSGSVKILGRMSRKEVTKLETECNILVVLENFSKNGTCIQVPGKLYHYGLSDKQVLVISESSNIAEAYEKYGRFVFVPNDKIRIAEAIGKLQKGNYENITPTPVTEFMPDQIVRNILKIIS